MHLLNKKILVFVTGLILISAFAYYLAVSFKDNNDIQKQKKQFEFKTIILKKKIV